MVLSNCPKCDSSSVGHGMYDFAGHNGTQLIRWHYINCRNCGYQTKSTQTEDEAIGEWGGGS